MGNFKYKLARFFYGRYGMDQLHNFLYATTMILMFLALIFTVLAKAEPALSFVSIGMYAVALGLMGWSIFRSLSRNITARRRENAKYLRIKQRLFAKKYKPTLPPDTADHVFRACPHCRATIRLPREQGKHTVICPRCHKRFGVRVKK
jgi:ssDNA-binding Zn-finger/Zn-ribbon topoisomerase 1